ncbi:MAG: HAD hydrolase-like protein, partial [Nitrospirota bacterium]
DGTLIDSGGAGTRALTVSFQELFSIDNAFDGIKMAGKTDLQIVSEACEVHGINFDDDLMGKVERRYIELLKIEIRNSDKKLKPGVKKSLEALEARNDCVLGILTGNIEMGARIKLSSMGIHDHFKVGAYGSDNKDRNSLLPIAVRKYSDISGIDVPFENCVVIGDTPRDVECSKPYGAKCIAVATGPYSFEDLSETEADIVLEDLKGVDEYVCSM